MKEVVGKFNTAKIFTDVVDEASLSQVLELCNQEFTKESRIRLMPDIHAGVGCTIGTTMTIKDKVVPNLVGVDIGCGMTVAKIYEDNVDFEKLDSVIKEYVPSGFRIHDNPHFYSNVIDFDKLKCKSHVDIERAKRSIGTLGGGNHFIEVDKDNDGNIYIVVHSGSRHIGLEVANYYQNEAYKNLSKPKKDDINSIIRSLKSQNREKEIQDAIIRFKEINKTNIPKNLAYIEGIIFDDYINDMQCVQSFAFLNRSCIIDAIIEKMNFHIDEQFTTIHNYIDIDAMILRKGAVSARAGEKLLIPINMRDGSLLCLGKGNEDWNFSAPHGAGRIMSRNEAKRKVSISEFSKSMEGIYSTSISEETLDECPMAYKNINDIVDNIGPTVDVLKVIKPIYNFKAGESNG